MSRLEELRRMFASFVDVLNEEDRLQLAEECKILFTALSKNKESRYSEGQTFWYDCQSETHLGNVNNNVCGISL